MAWVWHPLGLYSAVVACACAALALLILFARPDRTQNKLLATLLGLGSISLIGGLGVNLMTTEPDVAFASQVTSDVSTTASLFVYLAFLGTIASPYSRPFASVGARRALLACAVASASLLIVRPDIAVSGVAAVPYATLDAVGAPYHAWLFKYISPAIYGYGILVAWSALVRTPRGSLARHQASAYTLAAVWFDVVGVLLGIGALLKPWTNVDGLLFYLSGYTTRALVYALLLGYGILRAQLFDIDLKIKWTIRKSTVGAAFVGVFFVVSEGAQSLFSEQLGPLAGLLAAGALVFAIAPLQRFADGLADRALPRVRDTPEYRTVRKREVYRAAVESALEGGGDISPKERGMLATLQDQLGIGAKDAHDIERDVRTERAGTAG